MLTARWFAAALGIPALLILASTASALIGLAFAYALGLIVLTWLDRQSAGNADQFRVHRDHDQKLSLGVSNLITLKIEARGGRPTTLTVSDDTPVDFVILESNTTTIAVLADETATHSYHVLPLRRGNYQFGHIHLRWTSPLKLFTRQSTIKASEAVKVYPNIYAIHEYELLVRRDQLAEMGVHSVRLRQEGTVFESLRDYVPDDPYRAINWKATARRGKPITTQYEPDRSQRIVIALDIGRMMRSAILVRHESNKTWNMAKVDFVINSMLLLSYVASRKGDQVGLLVFADRVERYIPPGPGMGQFHKLLELMYDLESQPVEADYARAINYLRAHQKKRALIILFTDLGGIRSADALRTYMPQLAPQHLPLLVTIRDPSLDQEATQAITNSDTVYRRVIAEQLVDERQLLLEQLRRRGVLTLDVNAEHLSARVVNQYLQLKGRLAI